LTATIPFVDLRATQEELGGELEAAVSRVLDSGWYLLGPELEEFEREFATYCGSRHCVGVGSGLSALELILRAAGVGPGDEVIVPAYTWIASWIAVSLTGAKPVGVDVLEDTYNMDPALVSAAVTERTAAIMPVHLRGETADMAAIGDIARANGLFVLEDAAQAHGARCSGQPAGSLGNAAAFSFYPSKNLGAIGDGGAVTTDDDELAERVRLLRNYGMRDRYEVEMAGVNSRLAELQAAALRTKLSHLDAWNQARRARARTYLDAFAGSESIAVPRTPAWAEPVWHLFVVGLADREACKRRLQERGIQCLVHYPVLPHLSEAYAEAGFERGAFPVAERLADRALSLPLYPQLTPASCEAVVAALGDAVQGLQPAG